MIVADNHFWKASKTMHDPSVITCPSKKATIEGARKARFATTAGGLRDEGGSATSQVAQRRFSLGERRCKPARARQRVTFKPT